MRFIASGIQLHDLPPGIFGVELSEGTARIQIRRSLGSISSSGQPMGREVSVSCCAGDACCFFSRLMISCPISNPYFYSANDQVNRFPSDFDQKKDQQMVKNKLTKSRVANSFTSVLSCRLREGYTVKHVNIYPSSMQTFNLIHPFD